MGTSGWFQRSGSSSFEFLLAEGDSVERSDRNVLQGTICFQLSAVFRFAPISDRTSATEILDLGSIPCLAFSNKKGHREDSTVCGRQDMAA